MSLPSPPRYDLWPVPMQYAMRLRGALLRCGPGFRGAAWPDSPRIRLATLGHRLSERQCASHLTAAWVWGAIDSPGTPLCIANPAGSLRHAPAEPGIRRIGLRLTQDEVDTFGGFGVTTRLRTLSDLLHDDRRFDEAEATACIELLHSTGLSAQEFRSRLDSRRKPHRRLAAQRLQEIVRIAPVRLAEAAPLDSAVSTADEGVGR